MDDEHDICTLIANEGHRLSFKANLDGHALLVAPESFVDQGKEPEEREITIPGELLARLVEMVVAEAVIAPGDAPIIDLELLRKLASGVGGERTGALKRAGLIEWQVTPAGIAALNEASQGQRPIESATVAFAREELQRAGMFDDDADYGGSLGHSVLGVVAAFFSYGHSGGSAGIALMLLERLLRHKPLTPLTDDPTEWVDCRPMTSGPLWQSRRSPSCFSLDGGRTWYDQDADDAEADVLCLARCLPEVLDGRAVKVSRAEMSNDVVLELASGDRVMRTHAQVLAETGLPIRTLEPAE